MQRLFDTIAKQSSTQDNILSPDNNNKILSSLNELSKYSTSEQHIGEMLSVENSVNTLTALLRRHEQQFQAPVLSLLANCANIHQLWRRQFLKTKEISTIARLVEENSNCCVTSRAVRLLANLCKDPQCLDEIVASKETVVAVVTHTASCSQPKCHQVGLRALRIMCATKSAAKTAAEDSSFSYTLSHLDATEKKLVTLTLRMMCEMLKTQSLEVMYRAVEMDVLRKLIALCKVQTYHDLTIEILYLLSLNSGCRVGVAMEGGIEVFADHVKTIAATSVTFKYATQGLCLCSREAVSRNRMKIAGVLPLLVNILRHEECSHFSESIVAALVWFLFDDASLAVLIRANITPALLKYLDRLTKIDYLEHKDLAKEEEEETHSSPVNEDILRLVSSAEGSFPDHRRNLDITHQELGYSSPETSPYNPDSPQYSIPAHSPNVSPSYSPPMSPMRDETYDSYRDLSSQMSPKQPLPYHHQSADGQLAMIHGNRGPVHDIMLLLSRFSQASDPSSFFLDTDSFNSLCNYLTLSTQPNPKCARVLNRLTLNSHCFDIMVRRQLIPRLHLRLCTGYTLEHLAALLGKAREKIVCLGGSPEPIEKEGTPNNLYIMRKPSCVCADWGKFFLSNLRTLSESAYGKGVFSAVFNTGSHQLKQTCIVSAPYVLWSARLQKRIMLELRALDLLIDMMRKCEELSDEVFVLTVEALCALAQMLELSVPRVTLQVYAVLSRQEDKIGERLTAKRRKLNKPPDEDHVNLKMASGKVFRCRSDVLVHTSQVFQSMFNVEFSDHKQSFIRVLNCDENAFEQLLHYLCGCTIRLDEFPCCLNDKCTLKSQQSPNDEKQSVLFWSAKEESEEISCKNTVTDKSETSACASPLLCEVRNLDTKYAIALLECCEQYFVDDLKSSCERYLASNLNDKNLADLLFAASRHRSALLLEHSLTYLLTRCDCPLARCQCFASVLHSTEKECIISALKKMLTEALNESREHRSSRILHNKI